MRQTVLSDSSNTIVPNTVTEELETKMTVTNSICYEINNFLFFAFHIFPINNKWAESTELFLTYCFNLSEEFTAEHVKTVNTKADSEQMDTLINLLKPAQSSPL